MLSLFEKEPDFCLYSQHMTYNNAPIYRHGKFVILRIFQNDFRSSQGFYEDCSSIQSLFSLLPKTLKTKLSVVYQVC